MECIDSLLIITIHYIREASRVADARCQLTEYRILSRVQEGEQSVKNKSVVKLVVF